MKLGFVSDSLSGLSFEDMLDHAARLGVSGVEINTCGWSTAPHCSLDDLLDNSAAQKTFLKAFADRGLEIIAFNANGNPLHPTDPKQGADLRLTDMETVTEHGRLVIDLDYATALQGNAIYLQIFNPVNLSRVSYQLDAIALNNA